MKRVLLVLCLVVILSGCGATETFETISDDLLQPVMGQMRQVVISLPKSATVSVMNETDDGKLYLCDGYVLTVQTLDGGDLNRTAQTLSGFTMDQLGMVETAISDGKRYDWVWTAAGEGGDHIGRAAVLDDGDYHYCVTVMADAKSAGHLEDQWNGIFSSLDLA